MLFLFWLLGLDRSFLYERFFGSLKFFSAYSSEKNVPQEKDWWEQEDEGYNKIVK